MQTPDLILRNGRITTLDVASPQATHLAIKDGRILTADNTGDFPVGPETQVIDLQGLRSAAS